MGGGSWTTKSFANYVTDTRGVSADTFTTMSYTAQDMYKANHLSAVLNPMNVMRECCDSEEHPNTLPVILALDVTGSMGDASVKVAQKLNQIMTDLYSDDGVKDIEFCIMGIGDVACDDSPVQMSQFESDIRIAEQLDQLYFEGGGGGNSYESYSAAWYMGVNHCKLDCWNRGQKGIIITLGDELPNPYIPASLGRHTQGHYLQGSVETSDLIEEAKEKYDLYHISVKDRSSSYDWNNNRYNLDKAWSELLGEDHYFVATLDNLANTIVNIVKNHATETISGAGIQTTEDGNEVTW